jgi:GAF domain-containing protein
LRSRPAIGKNEESLALLAAAVDEMLKGEDDIIAALANISAAIKVYLEDLNWAGFYFLKGKDLVLGPFQGLPACTRIKEGKGVCGKAVQDRQPVLVADVHTFPGHIACDSASASEIVIPLFRNGEVYGVLDIDSPKLNRFTELELDYLSRIGQRISAFLENR